MARSHAAKGTTRAEAVWGAYSFQDSGLRSDGVWLMRLAILAGLLFVGCLGEFVFTLTNTVHQQFIDAASTDLDFYSGAIWRELRAAIEADSDAGALIETLARVAPPETTTRGRRIFITDPSGDVVVSWPRSTSANLKLRDILGDQRPASDVPTKRGARGVVLANGASALVATRKLPPPFGQLALVHPLDSVLIEWRELATRFAFQFAATTALLIAVVAAYSRQTRRRRAAEEVNEHIRRRLETALSSGRCGLWDWDIARGRVYWSDSMHEMLGRKAQRRCLPIHELDALLHPEDGDLAHLAAMVLASKTKAVDHEFRIKNAAGEWIWLRARAKLVQNAHEPGAHLVGIAVDISDRKALAEQTAAHNSRLREAIDAISEAFVLWDARNRLVTCNSKFLQLHGLSPEIAIPGATYSEVMSSASASLVEIEQEKCANAAANARTTEARLIDGRWLQINERRTKDGGYVSVGADITALKRHEERLMLSERGLTANVVELKRSRQALEMEKQKLAAVAEQLHFQKAEAEAAYIAKSEFLANMSHELRTPLNAIMGFSDAMRQEFFGKLGSPKYLEYSHDIHRSGAYLDAILTDILEMSLLEAGGRRLVEREVDISAAVSEALEQCRIRADEKEIELHREVGSGLMCAGDHAAIVKALGNLLSNSVKFAPPRGKVRVRAAKLNRSIFVYVQDNGQGIEPEALKRLGAPFEQSRAVIEDGMKGSGLGLAITRALVDLHRGSLRLRSRVGVGTVALIRLSADTTLDRAAQNASELRGIGAVMKAKASTEELQAPFEGIEGNDTTARNPGSLSSSRNEP
ncbi:MAG: ATP-binding protein [Methylocystis sp.]